jgi:uncharacterized protein with PCYCGC motif
MRAYRNPLLATTVGVLAAILVFPLVVSGSGAPRARAGAGKKAAAPAKKAADSCKVCLEREPVLDPNLFARGYEPDVLLAYEAAKKYPDLIDRLHCFCECKESAREHHKTLLTCFTNQHAAGCGICQREAILAAKMKDKGSSDDEIEITVESMHKTDGHPPTFGRGL